jgi:transcription termination factor NusB
MIEIAKRYGDEWTKKLINALGNAMVDEFAIIVPEVKE